MSAAACGCCELGPSPTPRPIHNRPGLAEIEYRVGAYPDFRAAMLARLARRPELAAWTAREEDDYGMVVLDLWSYLADILTFYQERTANEAFLRTARLRGSLRRLAGLIGYVPSPGLAAGALLAFTLDPGRRLTLEQGTRVQSVPGDEQGAKPQKFETDEPLDARAEFGSVPVWPLPTGSTQPGEHSAVVAPASPESPTPPVGSELIFHALDSGIVERRRVTGVGKRRGQTELRWEPPRRGDSPAVISPMRRSLRLFGHDAPPRWLPSYLDENGDLQLVEVPVGTTQEVAGHSFDYTIDLEPTRILALDAEYEGLAAGALLLVPSASAGESVVATVTRVRSGPAARGPLAGTVTLVELDADTPPIADVRTVELYEVGKELSLAVPRPGELVGSHLLAEWDGRPPLERGRWIILADRSGAAHAASVVSSKPGTVGGEAPDPDHLEIEFAPALPSSLDPDSTRMYANVAVASHGERVADELLGKGDASAFQTLRLAKAPVTQRLAPGGGRSAGSSLRVRVGGLRWHGRDSLYGAGPDERVFVAQVDDSGRTAVRFGGESARPATGAEIRAEYRHGLGAAGNVPAGALNVPLDRPAGLRSVVNPLPAVGGRDPEELKALRLNAPGSVRTFGRIVSLRDFEDQARATGLVEKARASWSRQGSEPLVALTVAGPGGTQLSDKLRDDLATDLDARRDPNRRLRIDDHVDVAIAVSARIVARHPDRSGEDVAAAAGQALERLFAFEARELGQPVHLSDVFAALQGAPGVVGVDVDRFGYLDPAAWVAHEVAEVVVAERLPIGPGELAALAAKSEVSAE
jgi:hypothetical protein